MHDLLSQFGSIYVTILICEHIRKTWTLYFRRKDDFINGFQVWLPYVEAESEYSMKLLPADVGKEFISNKLRSFCKKQGITI